MSKIVLSGAEFKLLCEEFRAPKAGDHIKWREFSDQVDEVFTKKNLEKSVDIPLGNARTQSFYGQKMPDDVDAQNVAKVQEQFMFLINRERLDAKSFFQDQDRHNHFKVSPKQFKQTVTLLGVLISDAEVASIVKVYGNKLGDIQYLPFLNDCACLKYVINEAFSGAKATYQPVDIDFTGAKAVEALMTKVMDMVKRNRIRIGEFLQDHDPLRKGKIDATKFRTTLYAQKI
jgi:Ca2+-binding EF-hand superfamily protein